MKDIHIIVTTVYSALKRDSVNMLIFILKYFYRDRADLSLFIGVMLHQVFLNSFFNLEGGGIVLANYILHLSFQFNLLLIKQNLFIMIAEQRPRGRYQ